MSHVEIPGHNDRDPVKEKEQQKWANLFRSVVMEARISGIPAVAAQYTGVLTLSPDDNPRFIVDPAMPNEIGNPQLIVTDIYYPEHTQRGIALATWYLEQPQIQATWYYDQISDEKRLFRQDEIIDGSQMVLNYHLSKLNVNPSSVFIPPPRLQ